MKSLLTLVLGLALFLATDTTNAQSPFSWEIRAGVDFATQDVGDADLNTGFGFEGTLAYHFMPHLSAYAGWGWHRFSADDSFAGSSTDFEETGYTFGLHSYIRLELHKPISLSVAEASTTISKLKTRPEILQPIPGTDSVGKSEPDWLSI